MINEFFSKNKIYSNIHHLSGSFKGILLDAYGVFWGGNDIGLLPGCKQAMEKLVAEGKIVGILSNSTQLVQNEVDKLRTWGLVEGKHFHFFITSGQIAKTIFSQQKLPFPTPNKKFYSFGRAHPKFSSTKVLFADSLYEETEVISEANFVYISIPHINGEDQTDPHVFDHEVSQIYQYRLPMVCANPDHFAHEGTPPRLVVRQGTIAAMYEKLGGEVFYIGKPSEKMFAAAMKVFLQYNVQHIKDVLMVGDTPETDIRGASTFGMPSALILSTGIMSERLIDHSLEEVIKSFSSHDFPTYFLKGLA